MVGEGVLLECLERPAIEQVLMVNPRSYSAKHPKLKECLVPDCMDLDGFTNQLTVYDACLLQGHRLDVSATARAAPKPSKHDA